MEKENLKENKLNVIRNQNDQEIKPKLKEGTEEKMYEELFKTFFISHKDQIVQGSKNLDVSKINGIKGVIRRIETVPIKGTEINRITGMLYSVMKIVAIFR